MRFVSTRDENNKVGFKQAVLDCMPQDGGLYIIDECEDLRKWILYADEKTSFANIAGSLTSAFINEEFSPIICEAIATYAFDYEPVLKKLDDHLYVLELFHGPTGTYKDFGTSYLAAAIETMLIMDKSSSILFGTTTGILGVSLARALEGKSETKGVLLYPKGCVRGLKDSDLFWNGGNVYPVEIDGSEEDCHNLMRKIMEERACVEKYHLTVANTANIGRLLPQSFFYTFAFTRLKKEVFGDIYYSQVAGNYGNIVSGLYSWKVALPVNGFIVPSTPNLCLDVTGKCTVMDSIIPLDKRAKADPADPSNIERLEHIFKANSLLLRSFIFPSPVSQKETEDAARELFVKYHYFADRETSSAYAATKKRSDIVQNDEGTVVLIARDDPALNNDFIKSNIGESAPVSDNIKKSFDKNILNKKILAKDDIEGLKAVFDSVSE